ncbi:MAG: WD40 repeat domain-containing protein [Roseimicrobium sp.]
MRTLTLAKAKRLEWTASPNSRVMGQAWLVRGVLAGVACVAAEVAAAGVSFTREIAPILADKCLTCHQEKKAKGRYRVDTFEQVSRAGDSGEKPLVPGNAQASLLYQRLITHEDDERMPQKDDPLPAAQIALFKKWIAAGAKLDSGTARTPLVDLLPKTNAARAPEKYPRPLPVTALAFSDNGETFWSSGYHEVLEWSGTEGKLLRRISGLPERVLSLSAQPGGDLLAVAGGVPGRSGEAVVVSRGTGKVVKRLPAAADTWLSTAFSPDGKLLALGGTDSAIRVYFTKDWSVAWSAEAHADWVLQVAFSPDARWLVSASRDRTARVFHAASGEPSVTNTTHGAAVTCATFHTDSKTLFSAAADGEVRRWVLVSDAEGDRIEQERVLKSKRQEVTRLVAYAENVVTTSADGRVRIYEADGKKESLEIKGMPERVDALAVHAASQRAIFGGVAGTVRMIDLASKAPVFERTLSPGY